MNARAWIESTKSGKYQVRHIDVEGKKITDYGGILFKAEAKKLKKIVEERISNGLLGEVDLTKEINKLVETFKNERETSNYAVNTLNHYEACFKAFINDNNLQVLGDITRDLIKAWKERMYKDGLMPWTIRGRLANVRVFLNWCVDNEYLKVSPFGLKMMPKKIEVEPRFYTKEEFKALDEALALINHPTRILCNLAQSAGLRKHEALTARWENIEWSKDEGAELTLEMQTTKTKTSRTVILDPGMIKILGSRSSGFLVGNLSRCAADHYFQQARKKAGINSNLTIHGLRHTFAKNMLQDGNFSLAAVKELMGHRNINSTMIYAQFEKSHFKEGIMKAYQKRKTAEALIERESQNVGQFPGNIQNVGQL